MTHKFFSTSFFLLVVSLLVISPETPTGAAMNDRDFTQPPQPNTLTGNDNDGWITLGPGDFTLTGTPLSLYTPYAYIGTGGVRHRGHNPH